MRPDEHKKKKSAQYQRKHGSSGAKGGKNENDKSSSKPGKQGSSKSAASERTPQTRCDGNVTGNSKINATTSESDDEGEQSEVKGKSFRRREIASNWAKYDLPPADADDAATAPRGEDFNKLVKSAGGALAHFRFKDEENWEDGGASESNPGGQVLSLDCAELATSLGCLPLHTQLGLDADIFTSEQLTVMTETAEENRRQAGLPPRAPKPELDGRTMTTTATRPAPSPPGPITPLDPSGGPGHSTCSPSPLAGSQERKKHVTAGAVEGVSVNGDSGSAGFTDADLDSLLESQDVRGQGGEAVRSAQVKVRSPEGQGSLELSSAAAAVGEDVTEEDLDGLLAMEAPQSSSSSSSLPAKDPGPKVTETKMAVESAELEDWLDSVLDD
ncbi:uncharacterized protein LOC143296538 [Babylonia areolata]|uniref:uncharacterized protein LOC143296538 n=1 Tax=Babylonia areolata TaxID=304850 RepID=UPI003FD1A0C8